MKLPPGTIRVYYRLAVTDPRGRVVSRTHWRLCRSYVQQWTQGWRMFFVSAAEASVRDVLNALQTLTDPTTVGQVFGRVTASGDARGIVIGTDGSAVTITDFALGTQILTATMTHLGVTIGPIVETLPTSAEFTISRGFINVSGGNVNVAEVGLYCDAVTAAGTKFFMLVREVVSPVQVVAAGLTLTAQARLRISV